MKKRIVIILLVVALGVTGYLWSTGAFARKGNSILVSGNLELTQVDLSFKTAGKLVERRVDEGNWVKQGDLIARLDPVEIQRTNVRDKALVVGAKSNYDQLVTSIEFQKATLESDIAARVAELDVAQAKLDELLNGSRKQEIQQSEAAVNDAKAQLEFARLDWERSQTLFKNDDISKQQYDQYRTRLDSTAAALRQGEEKLALVVEGPRKEDIEAARAQVARAQAAIQASEADLMARRAEVSRARAQVAITQTQINDTVVTAPMEGVVLVKSAELGEVLAAGTTVVTIGDIDHPWLRAYINETDLGRIQLGEPAKLTTDSFPGKTYPGRISFISSEAEFTPKQIQTREERVKLVYRIKIDVNNQNHELKSNMPVDAEIQLN
jgi:HlyD family secretion protein